MTIAGQGAMVAVKTSRVGRELSRKSGWNVARGAAGAGPVGALRRRLSDVEALEEPARVPSAGR